MRKFTSLFIVGLAAVSLTPAYAQQNPSQQRPAADPNERFCEDLVQTGSRIAAKRFCGTRA